MSHLEHSNFVDSGREIGLPDGVHRYSPEDAKSFLHKTAGQIKEESDKLVLNGSLPGVDIHHGDSCFGGVKIDDTARSGHGDPHLSDKHHPHHRHIDGHKVLKVAEKVAPIVLPILVPGLAPLLIPGLKHHNPLHKFEHEGKHGPIHNALGHMHLKT